MKAKLVCVPALLKQTLLPSLTSYSTRHDELVHDEIISTEYVRAVLLSALRIVQEGLL